MRDDGGMSTLRREPLAEQAAEVLLERIRGGEWEVGQKLPGETTLAPQLGVGRSTIREAIRQLAGSGVLATRQGAGVFVTALDVPEGLDAMLRRAADARDAQRASIEAHVDADTALHRSIVVAAHNEILTELFDGFAPRSRKAMIGMLQRRGEFGSDSDQLVHSRILDAIAAQDATAAAELTRAHLLDLEASVA